MCDREVGTVVPVDASAVHGIGCGFMIKGYTFEISSSNDTKANNLIKKWQLTMPKMNNEITTDANQNGK